MAVSKKATVLIVVGSLFVVFAAIGILVYLFVFLQPPTRMYACDGASCVPDPGGGYDTADCGGGCATSPIDTGGTGGAKDPTRMYGCDGYTCVPDPDGKYDASDCGGACDTKYSCTSEGVSCVPDPDGVYDASDCDGECLNTSEIKAGDKVYVYLPSQKLYLSETTEGGVVGSTEPVEFVMYDSNGATTLPLTDRGGLGGVTLKRDGYLSKYVTTSGCAVAFFDTLDNLVRSTAISPTVVFTQYDSARVAEPLRYNAPYRFYIRNVTGSGGAYNRCYNKTRPNFTFDASKNMNVSCATCWDDTWLVLPAKSTS